MASQSESFKHVAGDFLEKIPGMLYAPETTLFVPEIRLKLPI
jgi:hypothetical protein